jgi:hypothetical protein
LKKKIEYCKFARNYFSAVIRKGKDLDKYWNEVAYRRYGIYADLFFHEYEKHDLKGFLPINDVNIWEGNPYVNIGEFY